MNKSEFEKYISAKHSITKKEASSVIDLFTTSVMSALRDGKYISLIGFGSFSVAKVEAREGRNPSTGEKLKINGYNQPRFKGGQRLKNAVNNK